jgi:predicted DNA-binding protein
MDAGAREFRTISARLPAELDERFRELAEQKERSVSAQLRYLIRQAIEDAERSAQLAQAA